MTRRFVFLLALAAASVIVQGRYVVGPVKPPTPSICLLCSIGVKTILNLYHEQSASYDELRDLAVGLCVQVKLQPEHVCVGLIDINLPILKYILDNSKGRNFTEDKICGTVFQENHCGEPDPELEWTVDLGEKQAPPLQSFNKSTSSPFTIVQLTDIHFDPDYMPGGNAVCNEPLCCHAHHGDVKSDHEVAGKWGDYRGCDSSWDMITDTFAQVKKQHEDIDFIYMTGDLIDHRVHATTTTFNNDTFYKVTDEMKRVFKDIPVFPCLGNHEVHPANAYAPTRITAGNMSINWLYEATADLWSEWLPADTRATILKGGYYTAVARPGLRVVALNNNHCNTYNWWLLAGDGDTDGQLQWMVEVLEQAESAGEKVHLLYHIPSGVADCYRVWSREFNRIVERFANTITAQFTGHEHFDKFQVFYSSKESNKPVSVVYNGGSVTPFKNVNPNYKVYSVDAKNMNILDAETWIYNLTAANLNLSPSPEWYKLYSFREAYGVDSMEPHELHQLAERMSGDDGLLRRYFEHYNLHGDPELQNGCDNDCKESLLCGMVSTNSGDFKQCDRIVTKFRRGTH